MTQAEADIPDIEILGGISEIADAYDVFIFDVFGVIHDGIKPFPESRKVLEELKAKGKTTCLLTNSPRRAESSINKMEAMGLGPDLYHHLLSSGEFTYQSLLHPNDPFHKSCGQDCWYISNDPDCTNYDGLGLRFHDGPEQASFILNALPGINAVDKERLKEQLVTAEAMNLPMICANPDLVVNIGEEQHECAGTYAAYYAALGGQVIYHGKPYAPVYEHCMQLCGNPEKGRVVAIGDSLHTDIAGANGFHIDSVFNLMGIHWEEIRMEKDSARADLTRACALVNRQSHQPDYIISGMHW